MSIASDAATLIANDIISMRDSVESVTGNSRKVSKTLSQLRDFATRLKNILVNVKL